MYVRFALTFFALFLTHIIPPNWSQGRGIREFDVCNPGATKEQNHLCLKITDCPSAVAGIRKGIVPPVCGFSGNNRLVCCATNTTAASSARRRSALSIVYQMCLKYMKGVLECEKLAGGGGQEAKGREFLHMAALGYGETEEYRQWRCGGSLISERFVLTAAHCVRAREPVAVVRLGELNYETDTDDARPEDFNITQIFVHPNYTDTSYYNDIALLKLDRDVKFNEYIRPICLDPFLKRLPINTRSIATGWGTLGVGLPLSNHLMQMRIRILSVDYCKKFFGVNNKKFQYGIDDNSQLCAGELEAAIDTCVGDSGGPLQIEGCKVYWQVGITSFGDSACAIKGQPAVYTRVHNYLDWIQPIVWPNNSVFNSNIFPF